MSFLYLELQPREEKKEVWNCCVAEQKVSCDETRDEDSPTGDEN